MDEIVPTLVRENPAKIVLVVMDGLGGFRSSQRRSELSEAKTPNLDQLAAEGSSGLSTIVAPGITPGSGAGHLALFGYDPLVYTLGRGALSAAGVGFDLQPGDVAARVNFCTIDFAGRVIDRRAGRITTEVNKRLCAKVLQNVHLEDAEVLLLTEREHRAVLILRGEGLSAQVADTDPQILGLLPHAPAPLVEEAKRTSDILESFLSQVRIILADEPANFVLLRGFDSERGLPKFPERYRLRAKAIASYPMYLGISRILGLDTPLAPRAGWMDVLEDLKNSWPDYDFFYLHLKGTDSAGEDGDFERKCLEIERVDATIPVIKALRPEVLCVTGDHSTPSQLMRHSWHPVPFVMWGSAVGVDGVKEFNEEAALSGAFGHRMAKDLMALMLAGAGRLMTYGA
ncbi:MAG: 2,3-bisphosphoglycerate-independent phosphoglycerate mutase [Actinomycetota bacterium]|nr:2,3-bisphosphoglycerate-independent phosphoglycerate mutase [Actinomycetota bacterium]